MNGVRYFQCGYGKATFYPVARLLSDQRFADSAPAHGFSAQAGNRVLIVNIITLFIASTTALQVPFEENANQKVPDPRHYVGDQKGIQGKQNSCHIDSTLFGLFALSDIFDDDMFLAVVHSTTSDVNRQAISDILWKGIVNPLRKLAVQVCIYTTVHVLSLCYTYMYLPLSLPPFLTIPFCLPHIGYAYSTVQGFYILLIVCVSA